MPPRSVLGKRDRLKLEGLKYTKNEDSNIEFIRLGTMKFGFLIQLQRYIKLTEEEVIEVVCSYICQANVEEYRGLRVDINFLKVLNTVRVPWPVQTDISEEKIIAFIATRKRINRTLFCLSKKEAEIIHINEAFLMNDKRKREVNHETIVKIFQHQAIRKEAIAFKQATGSFPGFLIEDEVNVMQSFGYFAGTIKGYTKQGAYKVYSLSENCITEVESDAIVLVNRNNRFSSFKELDNSMYNEQNKVTFFPGDFVHVETDPENDSVVECGIIVKQNISDNIIDGFRILLAFNNHSKRNIDFPIHNIRKNTLNPNIFKKSLQESPKLSDDALLECYDQYLGLLKSDREKHEYHNYFDSTKIFQKKSYMPGERVCVLWQNNKQGLYFPGVISGRVLHENDNSRDEYSIAYEDGDKEKSVPLQRIAAYDEKVANIARSYKYESSSSESESEEEDYGQSILFRAIGSLMSNKDTAQKLVLDKKRQTSLENRFELDDRVQIRRKPSLGGTILKIVGLQMYNVIWDNNVVENNVKEEYLQCLLRPKGYFKVNDKVDGLFQDREWYPGIIVKVNTRGRYDIKYDDGDFRKDVGARYIRLRSSVSHKK